MIYWTQQKGGFQIVSIEWAWLAESSYKSQTLSVLCSHLSSQCVYVSWIVWFECKGHPRDMCKGLLHFSFVTFFGLRSAPITFHGSGDAGKRNQLCFGWRCKTVLANFLTDFILSLCQPNLKSLCFLYATSLLWAWRIEVMPNDWTSNHLFFFLLIPHWDAIRHFHFWKLSCILKTREALEML